ncbi:MAG: hypothetical protein CV089_08685 [Nitrospira sp. WS110]|nr:hypothetical protein [Nitrospira sp. WS110]
MILVDANLLVYAYISSHFSPNHAQCVTYSQLGCPITAPLSEDEGADRSWKPEVRDSQDREWERTRPIHTPHPPPARARWGLRSFLEESWQSSILTHLQKYFHQHGG